MSGVGPLRVGAAVADVGRVGRRHEVVDPDEPRVLVEDELLGVVLTQVVGELDAPTVVGVERGRAPAGHDRLSVDLDHQFDRTFGGVGFIQNLQQRQHVVAPLEHQVFLSTRKIS